MITVIAVVGIEVERLDRFSIIIRRARKLGSTVLLSAISVLVLLIPSSTSGSESDIKRQAGSTMGQSGGGGGGGGSGGSDLVAKSAADAVAGLRLPVFDLSTLGIRASQYAVATVIFLEHPLTGVGGGNFAYLGVDYGLPVLDGLGRTWSVHNAYLAVLTGTGIIGFVLFTLVLVSGLIAAVRLARSQTIPRWVTVGSGCGLLAVYAIMFWNVALVSMSTWIPMLVLTGALVGTRKSNKNEINQPE
jgi:O-antigen ligase